MGWEGNATDVNDDLAPVIPEPIDHIAVLKAQVNETGVAIRIDPDWTSCQYCAARVPLPGYRDVTCPDCQHIAQRVSAAQSSGTSAERSRWAGAIENVRNVMVASKYHEPGSEVSRAVDTALTAVTRLAAR